MKWLLLFGSIAFEVAGTTMLKLAGKGDANAWKWGVGVAVSYILCFALLGLVMKQLPLGVVYATWSGVGVGLLAIIGVVFFGDAVNATKVVSFLLIIAGVVGLNLGGVSH